MGNRKFIRAFIKDSSNDSNKSYSDKLKNLEKKKKIYSGYLFFFTCTTILSLYSGWHLSYSTNPLAEGFSLPLIIIASVSLIFLAGIGAELEDVSKRIKTLK